MYRKIAFLMVFLLGTVSVVCGQTRTSMDANTLLLELGEMLKEIPDTKEECRVLLNRIKEWQEKKLEELGSPQAMLRITTPSDNARVPQRPVVQGTVADPDAKVWVIVHPMEVSDYWVQPRANVRENGKWSVSVHIGRPGRIDVGKHFEIMAVANPEDRLFEGKILKDWPESQWKSQIIEVIRK